MFLLAIDLVHEPMRARNSIDTIAGEDVFASTQGRKMSQGQGRPT